MSKPVAVIIGDIHFTPSTLELASKSLLQALAEARRLDVPTVINGDTLDSKAIIRAEVANRLMSILEDHYDQQIYINTGNHDLVSEKGEESALNFLDRYARVVTQPLTLDEFTVVPYQNSLDKLKECLRAIKKGSTVIVHQGVQTANMGHYNIDKTSAPKELFADFRTIGSHYHCRQDIKCGKVKKGLVGVFSYIGNPYTLGHGEAMDPSKGFSVLYDDGTLHHVNTFLRSHVIMDLSYGDDVYEQVRHLDPATILWLKIRGTVSQLAKVRKKDLASVMPMGLNFKLDLITPDSATLTVPGAKDLSEAEILDRLIDSIDETDKHKVGLKRLWREVLGEDTSRSS
jgi:hypothetical protein